MESAAAPLLKLKEEGGEVDKNCLGGTIRRTWIEVKLLWYIAGPAILTTICQYSMASITQTLAGHLGTIELAAVGMQNLVITGIGFGIMMGMGSALETLCGQAYGAGNVSMLGIYLQRSWVILLFTSVLLAIFYVFAAPVLKLMGQRDEIADLAGKFSIWMMPELFSFALNFPIQKYLQAQSKVMVMAWISLAALVLHVPLSWLAIIKLEMGLVGAAVTLNFSWLVLVFGQLAYILLGYCGDAWTGFSWQAFNDLVGFVGLSIASAVMICLEYWYLMMIVLLAGLLKNPKIAIDAASICMNVEGWCMMIPFGFTAAISVRVSNELGAGRPRAAKFSVVVVVIMSMLMQTLIAIFFLAARKDFPVIFTESKVVMEEVTRLAPFLCGTIFLSSIQPVLSGVAIGAGWQTIFSYITLGCYYIVGLACAAFLAFKLNLGLEGIWGGVITGISLQTIILIAITSRTNWEKEVELSKERMLYYGGSTGASNI